jgi:tRNA(Leu) C34 or U34 (ribose-2'-O)-methylase TrmL
MARLKQIAARPDLGYFGAALVDCKNGFNLGGVIRAVGAFNGRLVVASGERWKAKGDWRNMDGEGAHLRFPCYLGVKDVFDYLPKMDVGYGAEAVAIEIAQGSESLVDFIHPKVAMYVFGPEDGSLPKEVLDKCSKKVYIPAAYSLNLYSAATAVFYDRMSKRQRVATQDVCLACGHDHWNVVRGKYHCNACGTEYVR